MKKLPATLFIALMIGAVARADDSALIREANTALSQKDYPAAFSKFSSLAQHGNAIAQFNLGVFYFNGQGVPKDENQAFDWFAKAAAKGHSRALQTLQGVAARGNVNAQAALSRIEQPAALPHASPPSVDDKTLLTEANSALVHKDYATAFSKFSVLAQHGNATAQFNVGAFYFNGLGVAKDEHLAYEWLAKSAAQRNARALQIVQNAAAQGNENARNAYAAYIAPAPTGASMAPQAAANAAEKNGNGAPVPVASQRAQRRQKTESSSGFLLGVNLGGTGQLTGINNSSSVGLLAGYTFHESFGLELSYNALYRNANADKFIAVTNPGSNGSFDLNAISLTGQYTYALSDIWSLKGSLGAHSSHFNIKSSTAAASRAGNSTGLVVGLKVQCQASRRLGLRAGFDTYTQSGGITGAISEVGIGVILGF